MLIFASRSHRLFQVWLTVIVMQDVLSSGVSQTVHVLIATYSESAEMVKECILRLLMAPEPVYMEKNIYVCDDGHSKREGPKKRDMVEQLRILGAVLSKKESFISAFITQISSDSVWLDASHVQHICVCM